DPATARARAGPPGHALVHPERRATVMASEGNHVAVGVEGVGGSDDTGPETDFRPLRPAVSFSNRHANRDPAWAPAHTLHARPVMASRRSHFDDAPVPIPGGAGRDGRCSSNGLPRSDSTPADWPWTNNPAGHSLSASVLSNHRIELPG